MRFLQNATVKHIRRLFLFIVIVGAGMYVVPVPTVALLACGLVDVARHKKISYDLIEHYFMGNGIGTWFLSPINLLADLFSCRNIGQYKLDDVPPGYRREIEAIIRAFVENGELIKAHIAKSLEQSRRTMLTFKWYNAPQSTDLKIPGFDGEHRYIKTIAISVFNMRERTKWHFGPLRLTFRVLYNLEPINSRDVFIEVDDRVHYWADEPLFIFDDTFFHRSINDVDHVRYCLFMDIVRPNYAQHAFDVAVLCASTIADSFKRVFYKNWSFIR
jgi:aspartyl/asparaginyl beta-hydroxylase (cupin superfamily)